MRKHRSSSRNVWYTIIIISIALFTYSVYVREEQRGGWQYTIDKTNETQNSPQKIVKALTADNESVYFSSTDNHTYSLVSKTGKTKWKHEEQGYSIYPIVFGKKNQIFSTNVDGNFYALDKNSGTELWRYTTPDRTMIDTEPVTTDFNVLFGSRNGTLYALDKNNGHLIWTFNTKQINREHFDAKKNPLYFGRFSIDTTNIYLNSPTEKKLLAIDQRTGALVWDRVINEYIHVQPTVFESSIGIRDSAENYFLIDKQSGKTLSKIVSPEELVFIGKKCVYVVATDANIDCINPNSGAIVWRHTNSYNFPSQIKEDEFNNTFIAYQNVDSTIVTILNNVNGTEIFTHSFSKFQAFDFYTTPKSYYFIGSHLQCSIYKNGVVTWCRTSDPIISSYKTEHGLFLISRIGKGIQIQLIKSINGRIQWKYESSNIDVESIQVHQQDIYFLSQDNKNIFRLNGAYTKSQIIQTELKNISLFSKAKNDIVIQAKKLKRYIIKPSLYTAPYERFIPKNSIFELTVHSNNHSIDLDQILNYQISSDYQMIITSPGGIRSTIQGFTYDLNTWKFRFNPDQSGQWDWAIVSKSFNNHINLAGSIMVIESDKSGFIHISQSNPKYFNTADKRIFIPIGLQNCVTDLYLDGNPLSSWPLDIEVTGSQDSTSFKTTSMEDYFNRYSASGFNTYRWGAGNCSFTLWNFSSSMSVGPKINEGIFIDTIFSTLKKHNFHIWMSLLSFELPFDQSVSMKKQEQVLTHYLDYVVSRYASYIDVWELANEIHLSDSLIRFMTTYIRSIDPYKHPITTSWERPELTEIDITSAHWYSGECNEHCDQEIKRSIQKYGKYTKPLVFSEQGNNEANWDEFSATRYRIRLWLSFLMNASLIFWNMPNVYFSNDTGPSNIYLGPVERFYTSIFATQIASIGNDIKVFPITSGDKRSKVYAVKSTNDVYGYIYSRIYTPDKTTSTLSFTMEEEGVIRWIDPSTGIQITEEKLSKGAILIQSPQFTTDIVFRIGYGH